MFIYEYFVFIPIQLNITLKMHNVREKFQVIFQKQLLEFQSHIDVEMYTECQQMGHVGFRG